MTERPLVGWREWVALPDLGVSDVKAKIDTGARTSAVHAWDIALDGDLVRFVLHPVQDDDTRMVPASAPLVEHRDVRSSSGETELRPVIRTRVELLAGDPHEIELTLTSRDEMGFRMLLGREALRACHALVDPAASFLMGGDRHAPPGTKARDH